MYIIFVEDSAALSVKVTYRIFTQGFLLNIKMLFIFLVGFLLPFATCAVSQDKNGIKVLTYKASPEGFMSNSHLIVGDTEAMLIDAQFSPEDGRNVADLIDSEGKKLTKIIITHPHPDHYYGLELLGARFKDAEILGGPRTTEEVRKTIRYWGGEQNYAPTAALDGQSFRFEGVDITYVIFKDGESVENTVLYVPSEEVLFTGDLASNGVHMWLGEGRPDNWLGQLKTLGSIGPASRVYPGHGDSGNSDLLAQAEKYISDFRWTVGESKTYDDALERMKSLYPVYEMPQILEGSIRAAVSTVDDQK